MRKSFSHYNAIFARQFNAMNAEAEYKIDGKGRKVRVFTQAQPLTREIVRHFYLNTRVVEVEDALETIGYNGTKYAIDNGYLKEFAGQPGLLWVTAKAAQAYDLPPVRVGNGAVVNQIAA